MFQYYTWYKEIKVEAIYTWQGGWGNMRHEASVSLSNQVMDTASKKKKVLWDECENLENKKSLEIETSSISGGLVRGLVRQRACETSIYFIAYFCYTIIKVNYQLCISNWYFLLQFCFKNNYSKILSSSYAIINSQDKV